MKRIFLILNLVLISSCGAVKLKKCDMRLYKINGGQICRFEPREKKVVCRNPGNDYVGISLDGMVCFRNNFDRIFDHIDKVAK